MKDVLPLCVVGGHDICMCPTVDVESKTNKQENIECIVLYRVVLCVLYIIPVFIGWFPCVEDC